MHLRLITTICIGVALFALAPFSPVFSQEQASDETNDYTLPRSYTQEDLTVLVGNVQRPNGIVWLNDNLYTACSGDWTLYEIQAVTGATITYVNGIRNAYTLHAETTESGFNLWIPDHDTNRVMLVDERRVSPQVIASESLDAPWGITPLNDTEFLITNLRGNDIVLTNRAGETRQVLTGLRNPTGIAANNGFVYVANNGSARRAIEWFVASDIPTADDTIATENVMQPLVTGLQNVSGMVLADDGYLYFAYALGSRGVVGRVQPDECRDGGCTNEDVEIVVFTELEAPLAGLSISPDMRLFVHTLFQPEIYWLQLYPETS